MGLKRVTVRRNLIFACLDGKGEAGTGWPSFLARVRRSRECSVSEVNRRGRKEKMLKNIRVHCVQRQDLRTVTNDPITGLFISHR
jgi:peptide methionine sulfoxide reductase MsrB